MDQKTKDKMAAALGISPDEQASLDVGSDHHYRCRCDVCLKWWVLMGPEEGGTFGPFTEAEVRNAGWSR